MARLAAMLVLVVLLSAPAAEANKKNKDKDRGKGEAPEPSVSVPPPVEIVPPPPPPSPPLSPPVVQPPPVYYGPPPPDYYGPPPPVYMYSSPPPPPPSPSPPNSTMYYSPPPPPPSPSPLSPPPGCSTPPPPPPPSCGGPNASDIALLRQINDLQRLVLRLYWLALRGYPLCLQDDPLLRPLLLQFRTATASSIRQTSSFLQLNPSRSPRVNLTKQSLAHIFNSAFGRPLKPRFDAYANSTNFILAAFAAGPSLVSSMSIDALCQLSSANARSLAARLVAAYSRQDAIIRFMVYQKEADVVVPYKHTVADFATRLCKLQKRALSSGSQACDIGAAFDMSGLSSANVTSYVTRFNLLP